MSTVHELVDRTYREWLNLPDDQPVVLLLSEAIADSTTTIPYDPAPLSPDEEELLAPGVLVEVEYELCRIQAADLNANELTVIRGVSGTTAVDHPAGAELVASPTYTRFGVLEAVRDNVEALYPSLWHQDTVTLESSVNPVEVPANFITPSSMIFGTTDGRWCYGELPQVLDPFPLSTTGKAVQFRHLPEGRDVYLTYRARFDRPEDGDAEVSTLGVKGQWERIVCLGAAAQVISSRPTDPLTAEYLAEQLERDVLPPGSAQDIRNGLLTLRLVWLEEAARALRADQDHAVVYRDVPAGRG